jgi:transposase
VRTGMNRRPSPRQTTWMLLNGPRPRDEKTKAWIEPFRQQVPAIQQTVPRAAECIVLLRQRRRHDRSDWRKPAAPSPLASFAAGLRRDLVAVQAACSSPGRQAPVEGPGNRLQRRKRQMEGRAGCPLLRSRVLAVPRPGQKPPSAVA